MLQPVATNLQPCTPATTTSVTFLSGFPKALFVGVFLVPLRFLRSQFEIGGSSVYQLNKFAFPYYMHPHIKLVLLAGVSLYIGFVYINFYIGQLNFF